MGERSSGSSQRTAAIAPPSWWVVRPVSRVGAHLGAGEVVAVFEDPAHRVDPRPAHEQRAATREHGGALDEALGDALEAPLHHGLERRLHAGVHGKIVAEKRRQCGRSHLFLWCPRVTRGAETR